MLLTSEQSAIERLESLGIPLDNMFLLSVELGEVGLVLLWFPEFGLRTMILENESLAKACYNYLLKRGNRIFFSYEEVNQAIANEKWPGWDTCEPWFKERQRESKK